MPTGVRIDDVRTRLFQSAEAVLRDHGPDALTSRAVTDGAGMSKGVLHRHFVDFDAFLCELVLDRAERVRVRGEILHAQAGGRTVGGNLTDALMEMFSPVAVAMIPLITFRDELRTRLRAARPGGGLPILGNATRAIIIYLRAEQDCERVAPEADAESLALSLVGGTHLLCEGGRPHPEAVARMVASVMAATMRRGPRRARRS